MQKLCKEVSEKLDEKHGQWTIYQWLTDLTEEIGEVAQAVKGVEGLKTRKFTKEELGKEISDALYSLIVIANKYDINLEEFFEKKIKEYGERY